MESLRGGIAEVLESQAMTQAELAAALNVSQAAVSQWVAGKRKPSASVFEAIERALAAGGAKGKQVDVGSWHGPVTIPEQRWEPAFRPSGRFRLPLHIEWSGSDAERWRDAGDLDDLLTAYLLVLDEGRVADIVTWVDPVILAANFDRILWSRGHAQPWREALIAWGLM
jgi:transcriptional regulator with XRE-family HTH domain